MSEVQAKEIVVRLGESRHLSKSTTLKCTSSGQRNLRRAFLSDKVKGGKRAEGVGVRQAEGGMGAENRWTGAEIQAVLKGAERLEGPWADVPAGGNPAYRFFKVVVVP